MHLIRMLCILLLILMPGYSNAKDVDQQGIVKAFEYAIEHCLNKARDPVFHQTPDIEGYLKEYRGKWQKRYLEIWDVTYNVEKTQSLISPYKGTIQGKSKWMISGPFDSKEEAINGPCNKGPIDYTLFHVIYGYQNGKWVLVSANQKDFERESSYPSWCEMTVEDWDDLQYLRSGMNRDHWELGFAFMGSDPKRHPSDIATKSSEDATIIMHEMAALAKLIDEYEQNGKPKDNEYDALKKKKAALMKEFETSVKALVDATKSQIEAVKKAVKALDE